MFVGRTNIRNTKSLGLPLVAITHLKIVLLTLRMTHIVVQATHCIIYSTTCSASKTPPETKHHKAAAPPYTTVL